MNNNLFFDFQSSTLSLLSSLYVFLIYLVLFYFCSIFFYYSSSMVVTFLYYILLLCFTVIIIYSSIRFFIWIFYLIKNVKISGGFVNLNPYKVILYFFIPVINFFKPFIILRDIWITPEKKYYRHNNCIFIIWWCISIFINLFIFCLAIDYIFLLNLFVYFIFKMLFLILLILYIIVTSIFVRRFYNEINLTFNSINNELINE